MELNARSKRRVLAVLIIGLAAFFSAIFFLMAGGVSIGEISTLWKRVDGFMLRYPWVIFIALVILPGLPFPTSVLFVLVGIAWRESPALACFITMAAIALNMSWCYWLAAGYGRNLVVWMLKSFGREIPELNRDRGLRAVLILRLLPGFPLFLQNYLLGFLKVPFRIYLPVSLLCNGVLACGVILSSAGIASTNVVPMLTGLGLVILTLVLIQVARLNLRASKNQERG